VLKIVDEWKPIDGCPGYEVSIYGEVYSDKKGDVLVPQLNPQGYYIVTLYNLFGSKQIQLHRLVAEVFLPNPLNKPQVNHINGFKRDNRIDNLEWATAKENVVIASSLRGSPKYKTHHGLHFEKVSDDDGD
jgi:hypothetical protein